MTWEQKLAAMQALCDVSLRMRHPGNWYVCHPGREVSQGNMLAGLYGNGPTPEAAVNDDWRQLVDELPAGQYIVINAYRKDRRAVRWNGFMWADVVEEKTNGN